MLEVVKAVLGGYAGAVPKESIMSHKFGNASGAARADILDLMGKRLVWASETDEGKHMDAKVKHWTGGDTLKARPPYGKDFIEFEPSHTLCLITNHKPRIGGEDQPIFDRLRLIPFVERFVDDPQGEHEHVADTFLKENLLKEAPGILAWMVRGCIEWQKDRRFNADWSGDSTGARFQPPGAGSPPQAAGPNGTASNHRRYKTTRRFKIMKSCEQ